jgi:gluconokinase
MKAVFIIVMGVSGCGKTTIGEALAQRLGVPFVEGDALHPPANVAKMKSGKPLNDDDRWPWLDTIGERLSGAGEGAVASCSALKQVYRDRLRKAVGGSLRFVFLDCSRPELKRRMAARTGHFMPPSLLESQLAALEPPAGEAGVTAVNGDAGHSEILETIMQSLAARGGN